MAETARRSPLLTYGIAAAAIAAAALFLVAALYSYLQLILTSGVDDAGNVSAINWSATLGARYLFATPLLNSLMVSVATALAATGLGAAFAWLAVRTDFPGGSAVLPFIAVPHIIPGFQLASAWVMIFTRAGLWQTLTSTASPLPAYGGVAIWLVLTLHLYVFTYLAVSAALDALDPALEEAARISGLRPWRVVRKITAPLMVPAMLSGLLLCFAYAMEEFGAPSLLGVPTGYAMLTTTIYELATTPPLSFGGASVLSIVLAAIAVFVLVGNLHLSGRVRIAMISGRASRPTRMALGRWRWPLGAAAWLFLIASALGPLAAIALVSFLDTWGHGYGPANWTLTRHVAIVADPELARALINTLGVAATAAVLATAVGVVAAYGNLRLGAAWAKLVDRMSFMTFATPGLVVGLALLLAFGGGLINFYGTYAILVVAYMVRFAGIAVRTASTSLAQIAPELEHAGRMAGLSAGRVIARITLPLARQGILAGFLLIFINGVKEISATSLIVSQGHETLAYEAYLRFQEGNFTQGSAISLWMIALTLATTVLAAGCGTRGKGMLT